MRSRSLALLAVTILMSAASAAPARAREWFVRAGSEGGDGSQAKPFADPWQALEKCEAGDTIHVTGGKYFGKLNQGQWKVPFDNLQLLGGYDNDFKTRDPWTNRTELKWDESSKNWPNEPRILGNNVDGCVIDGLVLDAQDVCAWGDPPQKTTRKDKPSIGEDAIRFTRPVTIRNCVILNTDGSAISAVGGSTIENNLIFNTMIFGIVINGGDKPAVIRSNTMLFSWGFKEPGKGAYDGAHIKVNGPMTITGNIFAHSDSNSLYQTMKAEKVSITKNVFFRNMFSNLKCYVDGKDIPIDDKNMGDLEELGLKAFDGNEVLDPGLAYDPAWLDLYSKRTAYSPGKVTMDDMNNLRKLMGLPVIAKGGTPATGVAPRYDLDKAFAFMEPKNEKCKAGARKIKLESKVTGASVAASTKTYPKGKLSEWAKQPDGVNGKDMEMLVGISGSANVNSAPAQYPKEKILGHMLYDADGSGAFVPGFMMKGTQTEKICYEASMRFNGSGKPDQVYVVRGIAYATQGYPKGAFFIESVEKFEASAKTDERPKGRDWFIVTGTAGGNGTKEKPYKDPWQALEKCEAGDSIHVAEGEYFGKLKVGIWKIDTMFISLIGGYDKEFKERNPWTHPTLLYCPPDYKGTMRGGYTIEGEGDHTGAVVDGFVFDKLTNNKYQANGDIDRDRSDAREHLWLFHPGVVIRNCVFLNGNGGALRVCNGATIENNIFINHMSRTINMSKGHTTTPSILRNNTFLFSWEMRFGEGKGRNGNLLRFETDCRSVVDNNIFEFADNDAVVLAVEPAEIAFTNNVFSHNLFSHVSKTTGTPNLVVDGANFKQLPDLGFKKADGNVILPEGSGCPVDEKFLSVYLNRTAYTPGKVTMDEWNQLREMLGQPVIATGGKGPEGFMPAYPWKSAVNLVPKNPKCKAGARPAPQSVKFEGIERKEETFEYADAEWAVTNDRAKWDALKDKRISLKVSMRPIDNQFQLEDITAAQYTPFQVHGPEGTDSGGLPLRCYVKKGTKHERVVRNAKDATRGKPEELYVIKGIARQNRNMVVEVVERAE